MLETIFPFLMIGASLMMVMMFIVWWVHLMINNAGIVDIAWAFGLALLAGVYAGMGSGYPPRKWFFTTLVVIWGLRLASHLFARVIGHEEDGRYQKMRQDWGAGSKYKFLLFFEFQAFLNLILAIPFLLICINTEPTQISALEWTGFGIWIVALFGESLADQQLRTFKNDPANKGKTCRAGLWNYSRHPNYFFEWLIWVSYFVFALASPYGWISIIGPLLMLYFLFKVTGIPATETQALRSRGESYKEYQRTTSAFVPWFKQS
jgi:steroid 5-alpha reductase family enzyme